MRTPRLLAHLRSNVIGYLCLFLLTTGSAAAATHFAANSVGSPQLKRSAVTNAKLANNSVTAAKVKRNSLTGAQIQAGTLGTVPSATRSDSATNAALLGGQPGSAFQQRVGGSCQGGTAIRRVNSDGSVICQTTGTLTKVISDGSTNVSTSGSEVTVGVNSLVMQQRVNGTCRTAVTSVTQNGGTGCSSQGVADIRLTPAAGQEQATDINAGAGLNNAAYSGLTVQAFCHDATTLLRFENHSGAAATLNWFYGDGSSVSANGLAFNDGSHHDVTYGAGKVVEGQFIFSSVKGETTVNIHAYDGNSYCEVRGTAVVAGNAP